MKKNVTNLIVIIVLIILIIVRAINNDDSTNLDWISYINVIALFFSLISLYFMLFSKYKKKRKFVFFTGVCALFALGCIVFSVLLFVSVIRLDVKSNDIILLVTLLFSLPSDLYVNTLGKHIFNK